MDSCNSQNMCQPCISCRDQKPPVVEPLVMPLFSIPVPPTGPVPLIRDNVTPASFGTAKIFQHGGNFRMCKDGDDGFKLDVSPSDALWLIDELKLGAVTMPPFRRNVIWSLA